LDGWVAFGRRRAFWLAILRLRAKALTGTTASTLIALAFFSLTPAAQAAKDKAKPKFVPQVWAWVSGDKSGTQVDLLVRDGDPVLTPLLGR